MDGFDYDALLSLILYHQGELCLMFAGETWSRLMIMLLFLVFNVLDNVNLKFDKTGEIVE